VTVIAGNWIEDQAREDAAADTPSRLVRDVDVMQWTPPVMLMGNRIPQNALVCLYGPSGLGKTFVALDLSLCYAAHRSWLGAAVSQPGRVVYVSTEGTSHVSVRLRGWFTAAGLDVTESVGFYLLPRAIALLSAESVNQFILEAASVSPALIVLDTLARCIVGADENSAKDMGLAIAACDRIRQATGATVLLVHHTGKNGDQERGSSALRGAADTVLALIDEGDSLKLVCDKQKDGPRFEPLKVRLVPVLEGATCVVDTGTLTEAQVKAFETLRDIFGQDGATAAEWRGAASLSDRTFYRARKELIDRGRVVVKKGRYAAF
jgi:RecA-family ATPase